LLVLLVLVLIVPWSLCLAMFRINGRLGGSWAVSLFVYVLHLHSLARYANQ
jgi:hypothetical protein